MTRRLIVPGRVLCAAALLLSWGCYREPTDPAQRGRHGAKGGVVLPELPPDDVHAGLGAGAGAIIESREVEIGPMMLTAPQEWVRRQPSSQFLITEFTLPKPDDGTDDGRLTVSTAGGTIEDNLARWRGQFGGQPETQSQETLDVGGVAITLVDYSGTFTDSLGMFAPGPQRPDYRMIGAVIPLGGQLFFVKGYGPAKTIEANAARIHAFLESLKPLQPAAAAPAAAAPAAAEPAAAAPDAATPDEATGGETPDAAASVTPDSDAAGSAEQAGSPDDQPDPAP